MKEHEQHERLPEAEVKMELRAIAAGVIGAMDALQEAGTRYYRLVQRNPEAPRLVAELQTGLLPKVWERLLDVGRGAMTPLAIHRPAQEYHLLLRLGSQEVQEEVIKEGVKVYEPGLDGRADHRIVCFDDLRPDQRKMVFDGAIIRTPEEQRRWKDRQEKALREYAALKGAPPEYEKGWGVVGKCVVIKEAMRITLADLLKEIPRDELLKALK